MKNTLKAIVIKTSNFNTFSSEGFNLNPLVSSEETSNKIDTMYYNDTVSASTGILVQLAEEGYPAFAKDNLKQALSIFNLALIRKRCCV